jgi:hypothetical protein
MSNASIVYFYSFQASEKQLAVLLTNGVNPQLTAVNLVAINVSSCDKCLLNVLVRVGNPDGSVNSQMDIQFVANLKFMCIKYEIVPVVVYSGFTNVDITSPGFYRVLVSLLQCNGVHLKAMFEGVLTVEDVTSSVMYIYSSKTDVSVNLFNNLNLATADQTLCINVNNVGYLAEKAHNKCRCECKKKCECEKKCGCDKVYVERSGQRMSDR